MIPCPGPDLNSPFGPAPAGSQAGEHGSEAARRAERSWISTLARGTNLTLLAAALVLAAAPVAAAAPAAATSEGAAGEAGAGASMEALGALLGAMSGSPTAKRPPIEREALRALLPDTAAGERRTRIKSGVNALAGFSSAYAEADYGSGDRLLRVKLSDMGALGAMSVSFGQISEEETDSGSEKIWREGGRYLKLKSDREARTVDYSIHFASGVVLEIDARDLTVDEVQAAVAEIDPKRIEALTAPATASTVAPAR